MLLFVFLGLAQTDELKLKNHIGLNVTFSTSDYFDWENADNVSNNFREFNSWRSATQGSSNIYKFVSEYPDSWPTKSILGKPNLEYWEKYIYGFKTNYGKMYNSLSADENQIFPTFSRMHQYLTTNVIHSNDTPNDYMEDLNDGWPKARQRKPVPHHKNENPLGLELEKYDVNGQEFIESYTNPYSYRFFSEYLSYFSIVFGSNKGNITNNQLYIGDTEPLGLNKVKSIEVLNEPDAWWTWSSEEGYFTPEEAAACTLAAFDGNGGAIKTDICNDEFTTENGNQVPKKVYANFPCGFTNHHNYETIITPGLHEMNLDYLEKYLDVINPPNTSPRINFNVLNFHHYSGYRIDELQNLTQTIPTPELIVNQSLTPCTGSDCNSGTKSYVSTVKLESDIQNQNDTHKRIWLHPELDGLKLRGKELREGLKSRGIEGKIWITEWGYPSIVYNDLNQAQYFGNISDQNAQSRWLMRGFMEYQASKEIEKSFWHWYQDGTSHNWDDVCGIVNHNDQNGNESDRNRKESWYYIATLMDQIGEKTYDKQIGIDGIIDPKNENIPNESYFAYSFDLSATNPIPLGPVTDGTDETFICHPRVYRYLGENGGYEDDVWSVWIPTGKELVPKAKRLYLNRLIENFIEGDPNNPKYFRFVKTHIDQEFATNTSPVNINYSCFEDVLKDDLGNSYINPPISDEPIFIHLYGCESDCTDVTVESIDVLNPEIKWSCSTIPYSSFGTITVKTGTILTIEEDVIVNFCEAGQLIIEEGARVNLLGGTLTSCSQWKGVEMKGIPGGSQRITSNTNPDSNSDDTEFGPTSYNNLVSLSDQPIFYSTTGANGDAIIENAITGINCSQPATNWWPYSGGIIVAKNTSLLNNTTGVRIAAHPTLKYQAYFIDCTFSNDVFKEHVDLLLNRGASFSDCTFESTIEDGDPFIMGEGIGIKAFDAGFKVGNCDFMGLFTGTKVSGVYKKPPFQVLNSHFEKCGIGVSNSGISSCPITGNSFTLGEMPIQYYGLILESKDLQIGIHHQYFISGLGIAENIFARSKNITSVKPTGIYVINIGDFNNTILNNTLQGLDIGNSAMGFNATTSYRGDGREFDRGLLYKCNQNIGYNTSWDFIAGHEFAPRASIRHYHRVNIPGGYGPVNNTFTSQLTPSGVTPLDDHDFLCGTFYPVEYYYNQYPPILFSGLDTVYTDQSTLCNIIGFQDPRTKYDSFKGGYDSSLSNYDNAILLGDESLKEEYKSEVAYYQDLMDQAALEGYKQAVNNVDDFDLNQVRFWMQKMNSISGDMLLVQDYISTQENSLALNLLDEIPTKYNLSGANLTDFQNTKSILVALMNFSIDNLPSSIINNMTTWADSKDGQASILSRNILDYMGNAYPPVVLPLDVQSPDFRKKDLATEHSTTQSSQFTISPNPAKSYISFSLNNKTWEGETELFIYDIMGKEVKRLVLPEQTNTIQYSIDIPNGIYICKIIANNTKQLVTKMVITD